MTARVLWCSVLWCGWSAVVGVSGQSIGPTTARFVVGLAFPAERPEGITWPYESLPRAPYDWLVLIVDEMPKVLRRASDADQVSPRRDLLAGGRPLELAGVLTRGVRGLPGQANRHFKVRLDRGRLRLSLAAGDGARWRSGQGFVRVRLYDVGSPTTGLRP